MSAPTSSSVSRHRELCVSRKHGALSCFIHLEQQRQRRQQETKEATATRNMYRGIDKILENTYSAFETDEERENRLPTLQENVAKRAMRRANAYSLQSKMKIRREVLPCGIIEVLLRYVEHNGIIMHTSYLPTGQRSRLK